VKRFPSFSAVILFLVVLGAGGPASAQTIANGSLTGPIANAAVPSGWTPISYSPDTNDENNNAGFALPTTPFGIAPSGPSPDGGTWVGFGALGGGTLETFGQTVTGLTAGLQYDLSWYVGNFGAIAGNSYTADNAVEVLLDGVSIGSAGVLSLSSSWVPQALSFTATATSHDIEFKLVDGFVFSYFHIDGVSLSPSSSPGPGPGPGPGPTSPIPTMSAYGLVLTMLGLLLVAARRLRPSAKRN
jgi:hypothetical protein